MSIERPTMAEPQSTRDDHRSSPGQVLSEAAWLDAHFEAGRLEYEAMLTSVPVEPGWRVLDAGCGSGSYLPLLADRLGGKGHIDALDLAPENITIVQRRLHEWRLGPTVAE